MEIPFWAIYLFDCLRRILYLLREDLSGWKLWQLFRPAQAKFVVCDYTIENRLHGRRDVPPVAQMLAVLNSLVLSLMDFHRVPNVARQIRRFSSHPEEALAWLL